jgi:hypothetical protein
MMMHGLANAKFSSVFETFITIDDKVVTYGKQSVEDILS